MKMPAEKAGLEVIEEATHLLRLTPGSTWFSYYAGALPFVLGLLYFWSDMSRSALAGQRLPAAALGMTLLFLWMKTWQTVFAHQLMARVCGEPAPRWGLGRMLRVALAQTLLQPTGLFVLPVAFVLTVPFPWACAFYQNITALGVSEEHAVGTLRRSAWRQARLWTAQNFTILMVIQLFGLFVLLNVVAAVVALPFLLDRLLGIPTVFTQSHWAVLNSTFFAAALGLAYLCLDPLVKAVYVLRCFYGDSLQSGADLKADLHRFLAIPKAATAALGLVIGLTLAPCLRAADLPEQPASAQAAAERAPRLASLTPPALDHAIDNAMKDREFLWRLRRETAPVEKNDKGILAALFQDALDKLAAAARTVGHWVEAAFRWLGRLLRFRVGGKGTPGDWTSPLRVLIVVLVGVLVGLLAWLGFRAWQQRRRRVSGEIAAQPATPGPDLADENVGAEQLPEDGWLKLARELREHGELRLALRAFYLASLAHLAGRNLISLARFKSNLDYDRELDRRGHALPDLLAVFRENVSVFDRVWYGLHEVNPERLGQFAQNVERIKAQ
jgi:hypothetical protein